MKFKVKFVLSSLSLAVLSVFSTNVFAYEENLSNSSGENHTYLGKSIDVVRAENYADIAKNSILSEEYYKNINYKINTGMAGSKTEYIYGDSSEEILANINAVYSKSSSINGVSVKGFTLGAEKRFKIGIDVEYNSYYSKRYAECVGKIDTKSIYIENAGSILKQEEFIDNLSSGFKRDLEALKLGQMTYSKFFNNYGTHLITNYIIGDRFYGNAVFVSNEILIDTSFNVGFENSIGGTFSGSNIGAGISNNIDIKTDFKLNEKKNKYACEVSCASDFVFSNVSNIANSYKEWVQYTNSHKDNLTTVVDYDMDDLVPVWDLLPPNYENLKKDMEFEFFLYRLRNEKNYYFDETTFDIDLGPKKIVLLKQKKLLMI